MPWGIPTETRNQDLGGLGSLTPESTPLDCPLRQEAEEYEKQPALTLPPKSLPQSKEKTACEG